MADFDRYGNFKANGQMSIVPFVPINKKSKKHRMKVVKKDNKIN